MNQKVLTMSCLKNILVLQYLMLWQKKLFETKDKKKNRELVKEIKDRRSNLKDKIKKVPKNEIEIEKQNKIQETVKEILEFN